jgi:hypothetical protein
MVAKLFKACMVIGRQRQGPEYHPNLDEVGAVLDACLRYVR